MEPSGSSVVFKVQDACCPWRWLGQIWSANESSPVAQLAQGPGTVMTVVRRDQRFARELGPQDTESH